MEKLFIKNRDNKNIAVLIDKIDNQVGLAFIYHGLGGFKEQSHVETMSKVFVDNNYTTVRFDASNSIGESEGNYNDANTSNYLSDLEDVIKWAENQSWYQEPFCLAGHSLGSTCILYYAENNFEKVKALVPTSVAISGKLNMEKYPKEELEKWRKSGWKIEESPSKPGVMKELKWIQFEEDFIKYDCLEKSSNISMPILLVVGSEDRGTPLEDHKLLYNKVVADKELHVIEGSGHVFRSPKHLGELYNIFDKWIKNKL